MATTTVQLTSTKFKSNLHADNLIEELMTLNTTLEHLTKQSKKFSESNCASYGCKCTKHFNASTFLAHVPRLQSTLNHWIEKSVNFKLYQSVDIFDESWETSLGTYRDFLGEYTNTTSLAFEALATHEETLDRFNQTNIISPLKLPLMNMSINRLNSITSKAMGAIHSSWPGAIRYLNKTNETLNTRETLKITVNVSDFSRKVKIISEQN